MNRRIVGGIIVLIALVGIAGVFLLIGQKTDTGPKKVFNAPSDEVMQKVRDDLAAQEAAKPTPNGHRHTDGTWHEGEHEPIAQLAPVSKMFTEPLTFHKELLETNPVEALRLQCEERGHWSAKWIAEFSSDNHQAQALARPVYLLMYYRSVRQSTGEMPISDAEYRQLWAEHRAQFDDLDELPINHQLALMRIAWPFLTQDNEPVMSK